MGQIIMWLKQFESVCTISVELIQCSVYNDVITAQIACFLRAGLISMQCVSSKRALCCHLPNCNELCRELLSSKHLLHFRLISNQVLSSSDDSCHS